MNSLILTLLFIKLLVLIRLPMFQTKTTSLGPLKKSTNGQVVKKVGHLLYKLTSNLTTSVSFLLQLKLKTELGFHARLNIIKRSTGQKTKNSNTQNGSKKKESR